MMITEAVGPDGKVHPLIWPVLSDPDTGAHVILEHRFQLLHPNSEALREGWWIGFADNDCVYCGPREIPATEMQNIIINLQHQIQETR